MTRLEHEVHPYVEVPEEIPDRCICGLWRTHHLHIGISSAICTCMGCEYSRDPSLKGDYQLPPRRNRPATPGGSE